MKNISKYVTLNLLSILGYILLAFFLVTILCFLPDMQENFYASNKGFNFYAEAFLLLSGAVLVFTIIELFLIVFVFPLEFSICKFRKVEPGIIKIPEKLEKIHFIAFVFGIFMSLAPLAISGYLLLF